MKASDMKQLVISEESPLAEVYSEHELQQEKERWTALLEHFSNEEDVHLFSAPGRTEIGGNHT
ncbi:MAG TPA: galactokinase, partial [Erysipelotrichaceae bacterium]|nr:galactokinase [Erysipelotrichaceae bacterium]